MHYLYSILNLVLALFFVLFGFITLLLPWSETIRNHVVEFISENSWPWNLFGLGFILIGIAIGTFTMLTRRKRIYSTKQAQGEITISENVIEDYLRAYFTQQFPTHAIPYRFAFQKTGLNLEIDLPSVPHEKQKDLLNKLEEDIEHIFRDFIGYEKELQFTFSFPNL